MPAEPVSQPPAPLLLTILAAEQSLPSALCPDAIGSRDGVQHPMFLQGLHKYTDIPAMYTDIYTDKSAAYLINFL